MARADHQFNAGNQLMVRYFIAESRNRNEGIWGELNADPSAGTTDQTTHNLLGTWTHTFHSNLLNEFRMGLVRRDFFSQRYGKGEDFAAKVGLRGVSNAAVPIIGITGFQGLSGAPFRYSSPLLDYQIQESVSWFRGKHALKIAGKAQEGDTFQFRLKITDNRRVPEAKLEPHVVYHPAENRWFAFKIARTAEPLKQLWPAAHRAAGHGRNRKCICHVPAGRGGLGEYYSSRSPSVAF